MTKKRWLIALVAISFCLVSTLVVRADRSHPASAGGGIDPTCSIPTPCIQYTNNCWHVFVRKKRFCSNILDPNMTHIALAPHG